MTIETMPPGPQDASSLLGQTPWQTVGPFFHYALPWQNGGILVGPQTEGERITIVGRVFDAEGVPIPDALIEIWQANHAGRYRHPADDRGDLPLDMDFIGFGRAPTDADGRFRFETIRPGRVPGPGNTLQAPHLAVSVFGRGLLRRLVTRLYFEDGEGNDEDTILSLVPPGRLGTLLARRVPALADPMVVSAPDGGAAIDPSGQRIGPTPPAPEAYVFDIHLQGPDETVFFDV